jgi:hypothetical protein
MPESIMTSDMVPSAKSASVAGMPFFTVFFTAPRNTPESHTPARLYIMTAAAAAHSNTTAGWPKSLILE